MVEIPLTNIPGVVALVDDEDAHLLEYVWYGRKPKNGKIYAQRGWRESGKVKSRGLHREVLGDPKGFEVDHINGDSLDCRRENLRLATRAQNSRNRPCTRANSTGYKGVGKSGHRWVAQICVDGRRVKIGSFDTPEMAARAYDVEADRAFGEFARLNFPRKHDE